MNKPKKKSERGLVSMNITKKQRKHFAKENINMQVVTENYNNQLINQYYYFNYKKKSINIIHSTYKKNSTKVTQKKIIK